MGVKRVGTRLVAENADKYVRDTERASDATTGLTKTLKGIGLVAAGLAVGRMFAGLASEAVSATAAHEQLEMSMTSLVAKEIRTADATISMSDAMEQASGRAENLLGWIQDLAIKSPFSQEGVASAFRTALAYGFTSEEAQRLTAATIDFATATGQNVGVMNQVALALGQIKAKGKLAGQEILQLVNAGFSVNPILEKMGYTTEDVSAGLVAADEFLLAFTESLESDFGGAAERSSETINGLIDSLGDLKQVGLRELFGPAIQATLPILSSFVSKIQEMMPAIRATGQLLGELTTFIIDNREAFLVGAVAAGTFFLVLNAGKIITAVTAGISLLTTAVGGLVAMLGLIVSPLGLLAVAAAAIVGIGGSLAITKKEMDEAGESARLAGSTYATMVEEYKASADESHGWGYNLVMNFANGMADAVSAVLDVLINLGNQIAYWLAPGSPPRITPDIDQWGTDAMNEFLGGFASADFDLLKNTGQQIERYMRGAGEGVGMLGGIGAMRTTLRGAVAEFQKVGTVSAATLNKFDPAVRSYVDAMFDAEAANRRVMQAQEALTAVTEKYQKILNPLNAELDEIANRRQDIIDQQRETELQAIVSDENAPALAKELAQMELREIELQRQVRTTEEQMTAEEAKAQAALDAATLQANLAQEELTRQQALLDMRIEDNALLAEQAALMENSAGAAGRMATGLKGAQVAANGLGSSLAGAFDGFGEGIAGKAQQLLEDIKAPFAGIGAQFDELKLAWARVVIHFLTWMSPLTTRLQEAWGPGGTWAGNMALMKLSFTLLRQKFADKMEEMKADLQSAGEKWQEIWGEDGMYHNILKFASAYLAEQWGEGGTWAGIIENMRTIITTFKEKALDALSEGLDSVKSAAQRVYDAIWNLKQLIATTDLSALNPFIAHSPAPMALGLSQINKQMKQLTSQEMPALQRQSMAMDVPTTQAQSAMNQQIAYNQTTFQMGGNNINNGMDMAAFEAAVLRVVNGAL